MHRRVRALGLLIAAGFLLPACSSGDSSTATEEYPASGQEVRLLVPYDEGGGTDLGARLLASALEEELDMTIVVENIPTASGQEALRTLTQSEPDGYTLAFTPLPATNMHYLDEERGASFGREDFAPIGTHDTDPIGIAVSADSSWQSVDDLIQAAKANPGDITAGSSGVLAAGHLGLLGFEDAAGVDVTWATFEDSGRLRSSVIGQNVDLETNTMTEMIPAHKNGDLRILASLSEKVPSDLDGVASIADAGYPDAVMATNRVLVAPAGTPESTVDTLSAAMKKVMQSKDYQQEAESRQLSLNYMDRKQTQQLWTELDDKFGPIAKEYRAQNG